MKYFNVDKLKELIDEKWKELADKNVKAGGGKWDAEISTYLSVLNLINSLQQEQQMPDSTQLIAEWEKEKAVLTQKDFRGDAERMAYNAFLDGFAKGLGYGRTK